MSSLVAVLSSGKGTWTQINALIKTHNWNNIYLITNDFGKENFKSEKLAQFILVDMRKNTKLLRDDIIKELKGKLDGDVGFNMSSGIGEEHMAALSALLNLGVGIRIITHNGQGMEEL